MLMANNTKTAAFKASSNLTTAKVAATKGPNKAERDRAALERAIASSNKKLETMTLEEAMTQYASGEIKVDGLRNVYAMAMNNRFAFTLEDKGHHWSVIWKSPNAKAKDSNLRPIWDAIEAERVALDTLLTEKKHSNPAQVWSRVRERSYQLAFPGQKRAPRQTSIPAESALKKLIAAYTTVAKEDIQTERDEAMVRVIGEALIALKVDLAKINQKINK
jgi:hypothetical protein